MKFRWKPHSNHFEAQVGLAHFIFGPSVSESQPELRASHVFERYSNNLRALLWCTQVHEKAIASVSEEPGSPIEGIRHVGRCDGIISDLPNTGLVIWTADCVPVLVAGGGVIGAAHAGWRGCSTGIAPRLIRRFEVEYGVPARDLKVALGPAIGACHYPVGKEVIEALGKHSIPDEVWRDGKRVDLRSFLHAQIEGSGVSPECISNAGGCTGCDTRFASYRRDETSDRQFSMIFYSL